MDNREETKKKKKKEKRNSISFEWRSVENKCRWKMPESPLSLRESNSRTSHRSEFDFELQSKLTGTTTTDIRRYLNRGATTFRRPFATNLKDKRSSRKSNKEEVSTVDRGSWWRVHLRVSRIQRKVLFSPFELRFSFVEKGTRPIPVLMKHIWIHLLKKFFLDQWLTDLKVTEENAILNRWNQKEKNCYRALILMKILPSCEKFSFPKTKEKRFF